MLKIRNNPQSGLTWVETTIVIILLGIVAALVIQRAFVHSEQTRIIKAKADIQGLQTALNNYKADNGFYPSNIQGLRALVNRPTSHPRPRNWKLGGYLFRVPADPWGRSFQYLNPGIHNPNGIDIFTYGPTGQPGGTGENATIGNW